MILVREVNIYSVKYIFSVMSFIEPLVGKFKIFINDSHTCTCAHTHKLYFKIIFLQICRYYFRFIYIMNSIFRLCHFGPLIALFIIFLCYVVSLIDSIIWLLPTQNSTAGKVNVAVLTLWISLILGNFFRAIMIGPGYVPKKWMPKDSQDIKYLQFCQVCQGYKPPRAHHCRICRRCVLKMDHHCPWINNCCGHFNHTNFVLFVFFAPVGCIHALIIMVATTWSQVFSRSQYLRSAIRPVFFSLNAFFLNVIAAGLAFGTIIAVGILFYHQIKNLLQNATGIEQWIIEKAEYRKKKMGSTFLYPYDYGRLKNISQVINWKCQPLGDGYYWPVVRGCSQYTLTIEQLQQKLEKQQRMVAYDAVKSYSGYWLPCTQGVCTCLQVPCSDEPRISLNIGDRIIVSRGTKYWLYGNKMLDPLLVKKGVRIKGWFPSCCVVKFHNYVEKGGGDGPDFSFKKNAETKSLSKEKVT